MGRIAIMPLRWEQNGLYLRKPENIEIGPDYYRGEYTATARLILGGLPIFSNGRIGFGSAVLVTAYHTRIYFGIRLPKTTTFGPYGKFSLGYTAGGVRDADTNLIAGYIFRDTTTIGTTAWTELPLNYNCYISCFGNQLTVKVDNVKLTVTDSTYASGHLGISVYNGLMYYPAIDFDGDNPVWPTTDIAYLRFRVMRNNNPVSGAKVVAVHHKIADMMISNGDYPLPVLDKIGIAQGITGPDGWVEIPLDTDDGPWIVSVAHHDGQTWCTAEVKPAEMPILYV